MSARRAYLLASLTIVAAPATARAVASAELYENQPHRYGRFEARIRYAAGDGVVSSFFLWKVGSEVSGAYWNELDFEKLGADCRMQTNTLYGNPMKSGEQTRTIPADMCAGYHDYRFEWTPTYIAWSIDGQEIRRETGAVASAFADNAPEGMRMHFNVWPGNASFGGNFSPAILPVRQYISWVQYSSFQNGSFKPEWREEFMSSSVPTGFSTGTWASPLNLSTHDARNVTFANGVAVLSLTADNATGFTGAPPADNGVTADGSGASSGGSSNAGAGSGGANTGGTSSGGAATGGSTASGGAAGTVAGGGAPNGGVTTGGAASGGATSGGVGASVASGGAPNGGATTGGAANTTTGGTNGTGGSWAGHSTGGSLSGGAPNGGSTSAAGTVAGSGGAATSSGCGCRLTPAPRSPALAVGLVMLTALLAQRRARTRRQRQ